MAIYNNGSLLPQPRNGLAVESAQWDIDGCRQVFIFIDFGGQHLNEQGSFLTEPLSLMSINTGWHKASLAHETSPGFLHTLA